MIAFFSCREFDFSPPEARYSPFVGIDGKSELLLSPDVVKRRTTKLAEQIHRKADYFKHNTILSPIGDDFRFVLHT